MQDDPHPRHSTGRSDGIPPSVQRRQLDEVFSQVYEELRRLAGAVRRNDPGANVSSTTLVHEAWLKLKDSPHLADTSVPHFKAIAARAMRQVLVDAARRRVAQKRGGKDDAIQITLDESIGLASSSDAELIELDRAIDKLALMNSRQAQVVECRFFGGLNVVEAATLLSVSESVIERDWRAAKAWLASALRPAAGS